MIQHKENRRNAAQPELDRLSRLLAALSDSTRLKILMVLANGERSVGDLVVEFGMPQPTVSYHLGLLRMNDLVSNRRDGKQIFYNVASNVSRDASEHLKISIEGHDVTISERDFDRRGDLR
jgi:DNA-binding transcriptional ArsR family regulator